MWEMSSETHSSPLFLFIAYFLNGSLDTHYREKCFWRQKYQFCKKSIKKGFLLFLVSMAFDVDFNNAEELQRKLAYKRKCYTAAIFQIFYSILKSCIFEIIVAQLHFYPLKMWTTNENLFIEYFQKINI
jgi:hypothetical protein